MYIFLLVGALLTAPLVGADLYVDRDILGQPNNYLKPEVTRIIQAPDRRVYAQVSYLELTHFANNLARLGEGEDGPILEPEAIWPLADHRIYLVYLIPEGYENGMISIFLAGTWSMPQPYSLSSTAPVVDSAPAAGGAAEVLPAPILEKGYSLTRESRVTFLASKFDSQDLAQNRLVFAAADKAFEVPVLGYYPRLSGFGKLEMLLVARVPDEAASGTLALKVGACMSAPVNVTIGDAVPEFPQVFRYEPAQLRLSPVAAAASGAGIQAAMAFSVAPVAGNATMTRLSCLVANPEGGTLEAVSRARLIRDENKDGRFQENTDRVVAELGERDFQVVRLNFTGFREDISGGVSYLVLVEPKAKLEKPVSLVFRLAAPDIWLAEGSDEAAADSWLTLATTHELNMVYLAEMVEGPVVIFAATAPSQPGTGGTPSGTGSGSGQPSGTGTGTGSGGSGGAGGGDGGSQPSGTGTGPGETGTPGQGAPASQPSYTNTGTGSQQGAVPASSSTSTPNKDAEKVKGKDRAKSGGGCQRGSGSPLLVIWAVLFLSVVKLLLSKMLRIITYHHV